MLKLRVFTDANIGLLNVSFPQLIDLKDEIAVLAPGSTAICSPLAPVTEERLAVRELLIREVERCAKRFGYHFAHSSRVYMPGDAMSFDLENALLGVLKALQEAHWISAKDLYLTFLALIEPIAFAQRVPLQYYLLPEHPIVQPFAQFYQQVLDEAPEEEKTDSSHPSMYAMLQRIVEQCIYSGRYRHTTPLGLIQDRLRLLPSQLFQTDLANLEQASSHVREWLGWTFYYLRGEFDQFIVFLERMQQLQAQTQFPIELLTPVLQQALVEFADTLNHPKSWVELEALLHAQLTLLSTSSELSAEHQAIVTYFVEVLVEGKAHAAMPQPIQSAHIQVEESPSAAKVSNPEPRAVPVEEDAGSDACQADSEEVTSEDAGTLSRSEAGLGEIRTGAHRDCANDHEYHPAGAQATALNSLRQVLPGLALPLSSAGAAVTLSATWLSSSSAMVAQFARLLQQVGSGLLHVHFSAKFAQTLMAAFTVAADAGLAALSIVSTAAVVHRYQGIRRGEQSAPKQQAAAAPQTVNTALQALFTGSTHASIMQLLEHAQQSSTPAVAEQAGYRRTAVDSALLQQQRGGPAARKSTVRPSIPECTDSPRLGG